MSAAAAVASTTQSPSCVAPAAAACKQPTPAAGGEGGADHAQADASSLPCLSHAAAQQLRKLVPAAAAAVRRLRFEQGLERLRQLLLRLRSWVWYWIDELLEEFQPWLKWIIFDAVLTLLVGRLVRHAPLSRPLFEAIGWV